MELKYEEFAFWSENAQVLIVPLWNWNLLMRLPKIVQQHVLIVPLWNWNTREAPPLIIAERFNCTFMELK